MAGDLTIHPLVILLVALTSPASCLGDCDLSREPSMVEVQLFLDCTRRELYSLESGINDVITPDLPEIQRRTPNLDIKGLSFPFRYEDMADFTYCHGLKPEQCVELMRFLGQLVDAQAEQSLMDSLSVRMRRSLDPKTIEQLLKQNRPSRILTSHQQDIEESMKWLKKNGRGSQRSRWGRSTDPMAASTPLKPVTEPTQTLGNHGNIHDNDITTKASGSMSRNAKAFLTSLVVPSRHRQKRQMKRNQQQLQMSPELQEILAEFKTWRSKHGYGKAVSRWG